MDTKTLPWALYQGYSKGDDTDTETIRALFQKRYGRAPAEIHDAGTVWLAGPVNAGPLTDEGGLSDVVGNAALDALADL